MAQDEINWLEAHPSDVKSWRTVTLKGDMKDPRQREEKEKMIRAYVRGWLELHNDENKTHFKVKNVEIRNNYGEDTRFTVKAFIDPPPTTESKGENGNDNGDDSEDSGGHLIPKPPPPPDEL